MTGAGVRPLLLAGCLLLTACAPGLLPAIPFLTSEEAAARRRADIEIRRAELWMIDLYRRKAAFTGSFRKTPCDTRTGADCFQGDYECPHCLWRDDRSELHELGRVYDAVAASLLQPPPGTSLMRLNWLAGQRTGLWTRQGELDRARAAAEECRGEAWWCAALEGLVAQRSGDFVEAGRRFDAALELMPRLRACYWREVGVYRDSAALSVGHDVYGRTMRQPQTTELRPCPDEGDVATFWTLSDPLWSLPGNARRAEHFARMTDLQIHQQFLETENPHGTHLRDHHSTVLRHGWPVAFDWRGGIDRATGAAVRGRRGMMPQRAQAQLVIPADPWRSPGGLRLHYGRGQGFAVAVPLADALRAAPEIFEPRDDPALESYEPPFGPLRPLPLQSGFFRRDGRDLLVVRAHAPPGPRPAPDAWQLIGWNGTDFRTADVRVAGDTITATLDAAWEAQIVSLEAVHQHGAWRGRSGTRPPDAARDVAISSVILVDDAAGPPADLDEALYRMLPATRLPHGTGAGSYWELYAQAPVSAALDVTVRRNQRPGLLSRLTGGRPPELRVRWEEIIEPVNGVAGRTFDLDLHTLQPGPYQLELVLTLHDGTQLRSDVLFLVAPQH
jgi:hypothetical protein